VDSDDNVIAEAAGCRCGGNDTLCAKDKYCWTDKTCENNVKPVSPSPDMSGDASSAGAGGADANKDSSSSPSSLTDTNNIDADNGSDGESEGLLGAGWLTMNVAIGAAVVALVCCCFCVLLLLLLRRRRGDGLLKSKKDNRGASPSTSWPQEAAATAPQYQDNLMKDNPMKRMQSNHRSPSPVKHSRTRTKLPTGWGKDVDATGISYYFHESGTTSWEVPPGSIQIPVGAETASVSVAAVGANSSSTTRQHNRTKTQLPSGWSKDTDENGHAYYYRTSDGTCAWDKPPGSIQVPIHEIEMTAVTTTQQQQQQHGRTKTQLPTGWGKDVDADGNKYYYGNDGKVSWDAPPGSTGGSSGVPATTQHGRSDTVLPTGWGKDVDASGNSYYHHSDGTLAWEKPPNSR